MLHLRGVGSARSRVMTGRASGRGRSMAGRPVGPSSKGAEVGQRRGNALVDRSVGQRVAGDRPELNGVVEEKVTGVGMLRAKQKGKEGGADVKWNERNERNRRDAPRATGSGRNSKGLDGGIGRALGRSAARVRDHLGRTQRVSNEGRNGKIAPAGHPALGAWLGGRGWWGPLAG